MRHTYVEYENATDKEIGPSYLRNWTCHSALEEPFRAIHLCVVVEPTLKGLGRAAYAFVRQFPLGVPVFFVLAN